MVDSRLKGRRGLKFQDLIDFTEDLLADHRDYRGRDGALGGSLDEVRNGGDGGKSGKLANLGEMERLEEIEKTLGQLKGGGKGGGKDGGWKGGGERAVDGKGTVGKEEVSIKEADGKVEERTGAVEKEKGRAKEKDAIIVGLQTTGQENAPAKVEEKEEEAKVGKEAALQMARSSAICARV